jgi:thymidine phosphorylase
MSLQKRIWPTFSDSVINNVNSQALVVHACNLSYGRKHQQEAQDPQAGLSIRDTISKFKKVGDVAQDIEQVLASMNP